MVQLNKYGLEMIYSKVFSFLCCATFTFWSPTTTFGQLPLRTSNELQALIHVSWPYRMLQTHPWLRLNTGRDPNAMTYLSSIKPVHVLVETFKRSIRIAECGLTFVSCFPTTTKYDHMGSPHAHLNWLTTITRGTGFRLPRMSADNAQHWLTAVSFWRSPIVAQLRTRYTFQF